NIGCFRYVPETRNGIFSESGCCSRKFFPPPPGNQMRALIALQFVLLAMSSAFANQIHNGYVLQVHSDGRVVNVPLGERRQPLVGISMPNTQILTLGVLICCNYSGAEVFTLILDHERFTQTVFIGCSDPECPAGGRAGQSRNRFSQLRRPLAAAVRRGGATAGTGLTGVAVVLRLSPAPVAQTAHHQRDRALLRGSATENPTYGVLCERRKCGPHHLLHLPEIQSGMENPHPQPIYTSCLTSPHPAGHGQNTRLAR